MYKCEILADSKYRSHRVTTFKVTYPRIIHAEMLRHRAFSRNTSSSRAIPFNKMVEMVEQDPFVPIAWQKSHSGMQGSEYLTDTREAVAIWSKGFFGAIKLAKHLSGTQGVTKQICNRILEPYQYITEIITTTQEGLENFFELRCPRYEFKTLQYKSKKEAVAHHHELAEISSELEWIKMSKSGAEIHIQKIAEMMYDEYRLNTPKRFGIGEYHMPFGNIPEELSIGDKIKISVARCARMSYYTFGSRPIIDYAADIELYDNLLRNKHMSPFEHICTPSGTSWKYANLTGWKSHRYSLENSGLNLDGDSFADVLRNIILDKTNADIMNPSRRRENSDARIIFYSAMRRKGFSFHYIGNYVNKDHSTVIAGLNKLEELKTDKQFMNKYTICMLEIESITDISTSSTTSMLISQIRMMNEKINELTLYRDKYLELKENTNG